MNKYRDLPRGFNVPQDDDGPPAPWESTECEHEESIWNRDLPNGKQKRTCLVCGEQFETESRRQR